MVKGFKQYKYGIWKKEIRELLRKRFSLKDRIRYHKNKIEYHEDKIKLVENNLIEVEKELDKYLRKAGN